MWPVSGWNQGRCVNDIRSRDFDVIDATEILIALTNEITQQKEKLR